MSNLMNSTARKSILDREPRYTLAEEDSRFLCFVTNKKRKRSFAIDLVNISTTGLVFAIENEMAPDLGEYIKMEFLVPGFGQIACVGRVVRLERSTSRIARPMVSTNVVRVALTFENLNRAHHKALRSGLEKKIRFQRFNYFRQRWGVFAGFLLSHYKVVMLIALTSILVIALFYLLLQPSENYMERWPIPWGTRF